MRIDKSSPIPKYHQLKEIIREMVEQEELKEGEMIPSERELCERFGISRMTVRQAVMELVNEGVLYREQGRGTFVAARKVQQPTARLTSFTQDMRERGMEPSSEVLEVEVEEAGLLVARRLGVEEGERVIRLRRLRLADGEPMALETSHLLYEVAKGVLGRDLAGRSLYEELSAAGVEISRAEQSYEAVPVSEEEAALLGVEPGSAALLIERVTYDAGERPFEYVRSTYRGDRYRITATLTPGDRVWRPPH
ncbi:GntR family transcriptional regulator [Rubrobacter naiadicus]|uniref:GntR family transcriptional regulator n=1 Tax=Rubrobacter naiadicus TaxID=1392641 RepID=UPI00235EF1F5|nr:GntR family transcriptional regulator [Rubrobacter naiadicus]